uniref:DEP domain-containing protein n=1 Tax=Ciona savignyi TaxID=51511 RepID=H2ZF92_CIOSA
MHNLFLFTSRCGVNFVPESAGLPIYTFVSLEAIFWATSNVGGLMGLKDACMLFEAMCNAKLIIHASKDPQHPFMYGYIFYSINEEYINNLSEIDDPTSYQYGHSSSPPQKFHKRWFEVEVTSRSLIPKEPITSPESAFQSTPTHETPQKTTRQHKEHNIVKMVLT